MHSPNEDTYKLADELHSIKPHVSTVKAVEAITEMRGALGDAPKGALAIAPVSVE